jgi:hypothetical protein
MKIDFNRVLIDLTGEEISESAKEPDKKATLKFITMQALMNNVRGDESLSGHDKFKQYELAQKVNTGVVELTAEEIALIKERIGLAFHTAIIGPAYQLLEGMPEQ